MDGNLAIKLEGLLIVGGLIVFCVWQLRSLERDRKALREQREAERRAAQEATPATPPKAADRQGAAVGPVDSSGDTTKDARR